MSYLEKELCTDNAEASSHKCSKRVRPLYSHVATHSLLSAQRGLPLFTRGRRSALESSPALFSPISRGRIELFWSLDPFTLFRSLSGKQDSFNALLSLSSHCFLRTASPKVFFVIFPKAKLPKAQFFQRKVWKKYTSFLLANEIVDCGTLGRIHRSSPTVSQPQSRYNSSLRVALPSPVSKMSIWKNWMPSSCRESSLQKWWRKAWKAFCIYNLQNALHRLETKSTTRNLPVRK